jgi:CRP/FNR family transcriptional regulator, cyclic AMP receptor protein
MDAEKQERAEQLRSLALFRHLPEARLEELARVLVARSAPAGALIFEEGSAGDAMFLLVRGQVRIESRLEAGGFAELALLSPGDAFGEMALIERIPRSARAVAHTDVGLLVLESRDLDGWLASDPRTAMGFFAELLRVLSHRLRRSSQELVLLYDVSQLAIQRFEDADGFIRAALHRMIPHLDGAWSLAGYLYNEFNDEVTRVATEGPGRESLPATLPIGEASSRWLDPASFCVSLAGDAGTPLGFLVARNDLEMTAREKAEVEIMLAATGHLVASALQNIRHELEDRLRARLLRQQTYGPSA